MAEMVFSLAVGIGLLYFGAECLVRGSVSAAKRFGISPLFIGLTVVAMGTSLPEFFVSVMAALSGKSDISVGNIVGSNIANIGLVLGLSALFSPIVVQRSLLKMDLPFQITVSVMFLLLISDRSLSRPEGLILLAGFIVYFVMAFRNGTAAPVEEDEAPRPSRKPFADFMLAGGGIIMLAGGSSFTVTGAEGIARMAGISEAVIGATVVAVGTSLPELFTSIVAAMRGQYDLSIGNVLGSNVFNLLGIMGVSALARPLTVNPQFASFQVPVMILFAVLLFPMILTGKKEQNIYVHILSRQEGLVLLGLYAFFVFKVYFN
ncbi:MAG: calcium/sodium antiporter [Candidatus Wallbacteria bacterium]|nr:calcium/sodium antiporter [Candidatus Wallbacteria bacterium]